LITIGSFFAILTDIRNGLSFRILTLKGFREKGDVRSTNFGYVTERVGKSYRHIIDVLD